jgi:CubicO group peptidase (beta-lactamase class C family)
MEVSRRRHPHSPDTPCANVRHAPGDDHALHPEYRSDRTVDADIDHDQSPIFHQRGFFHGLIRRAVRALCITLSMAMVLQLTLLGGTLLGTSVAFASTHITTNTKDPSAETIAAIDTYLQENLSATNTPGASIEIVDAGNVLYSTSYGICTGIDQPFILGSLSKSFTAIAIMQLVETKKVSLDATLGTYLPTNPVGEQVTIRQLLNQTSGIGAYENSDDVSISGEQGSFEYSNANYDLLGEVITAVTGESYADYIEQNIFEPLGMSDSYVTYADAENGGLIPGYSNYFGLEIQTVIGDPLTGSWAKIPSGYLKSSAADMGRYLQMFLSKGTAADGTVVLSHHSQSLLFNDTTSIDDGLAYGMGWMIDTSGGELVLEHGGMVENYQSYMEIFPKRGIAVIMLFDTTDSIAGNELIDELESGVCSLLAGTEAEDLDQGTYVTEHTWTDVGYIFCILAASTPIARIRRWRRKTRRRLGSTQRFRHTRVAAPLLILHVIIPTIVVLLPPLISIPWFVIEGYSPDVGIVIAVCAVLLYGGGIVKVVLLIRDRRRRGTMDGDEDRPGPSGTPGRYS